MVLYLDVSIHAPTWGATHDHNLRVGGVKFQSTLPHGERLDVLHLQIFLLPVSIHAPTWGATELSYDG